MDLFQADRLGEIATTARLCQAQVTSQADLWDLADAGFQTLVYPVPHRGERALKLDMVEQAFHVLEAARTLIVLSPYDQDEFFPPVLKKVFGRVHAPMEGDNAVFWGQRDGERPRRRHETTYHVRAADEQTSCTFVSRSPACFLATASADEGARAAHRSGGTRRPASASSIWAAAWASSASSRDDASDRRAHVTFGRQ